MNPWRMVGGIMKYYRIPYDEIMYKRSYLNLLLLNLAIETEGEEFSSATARETATRHANSFFMQLM